MARNLYTLDLESDLRLDDIEAFVAAAVPEGPRVDYKEDVPKKLGLYAASFANAEGGLIFVGIKTKEDQSTPDSICGVKRDGGELKMRLLNKLISSIDPRPDFTIGVVALSSSHDVAVIRVEPGDWPPYVYQYDNDRRVPIRIGDRTDSARRADLEQLFARRQVVEMDPVSPFASHRNPDFYVRGGETRDGSDRSPTYLHLDMAPARRTRVRMCRKKELAIAKHLAHAYADRRNLFEIDSPYVVRESSSIEFSNHARDTQAFQEDCRWRLRESGQISFATQILGTPTQTINLARVAFEAVRFIEIGRRIFADIPYMGSVRAIFSLATGDAPLVSTGWNSYHIRGVTDPELSPTHQMEYWWQEILDSSELATPGNFVAEGMNAALRGRRQVSIDLDRLATSIDEMRNDFVEDVLSEPVAKVPSVS